LTTFETVPSETPASRATSAMTGGRRWEEGVEVVIVAPSLAPGRLGSGVDKPLCHG
jgi:hypothetical protein